jgi:hypothetical protein
MSLPSPVPRYPKISTIQQQLNGIALPTAGLLFRPLSVVAAMAILLLPHAQSTPKLSVMLLVVAGLPTKLVQPPRALFNNILAVAAMAIPSPPLALWILLANVRLSAVTGLLIKLVPAHRALSNNMLAVAAMAILSPPLAMLLL